MGWTHAWRVWVNRQNDIDVRGLVSSLADATTANQGKTKQQGQGYYQTVHLSLHLTDFDIHLHLTRFFKT